MIGGLTKQQANALQFIKAFIEQHGMSPTGAEICAGLGMSSLWGAQRLVRELEARGALYTLPGKRRSIRLAEDITLPPDVFHAVAKHAVATGSTPRAVVREAVAAYLGIG